MSLDDHRREPLLFGPSPIHPLPRLSEALGGRVEIWVKREDCNSGIAFGGNKVRKLEYLAADAIDTRRPTRPPCLRRIPRPRLSRTRTIPLATTPLNTALHSHPIGSASQITDAVAPRTIEARRPGGPSLGTYDRRSHLVFGDGCRH